MDFVQPAQPVVSVPEFAPGWALFLDIDGTLLDLAERPAAVHVDDRLRGLLQRLCDTHGGALALVSGRAVADVDALFQPLCLPVAGQHGVERRDFGGQLHRYSCPAESLKRAAARLSLLVATNQGLVLEDKGSSLAVHYRLAPHLEPLVQNLLHELAEELGEGFELQAGIMVLEIKPSGRNKGKAVSEFMNEKPFSGRRPVFIGDDLTDEHGFAWVNSAGGHSIKVGPGPTLARWRLPDAHSVRRWLAELATRAH